MEQRVRGSIPGSAKTVSFHLNEEMNQKMNKYNKNKNNNKSSNSLVFGRWPQTKTGQGRPIEKKTEK